MQVAGLSDVQVRLYQLMLEQAAREGEAMLLQVFEMARRSLNEDALQVPNQLERDHFKLSVKLLDDKARALSEGFPQVLRETFQIKRSFDSRFGTLSVGELSHDQLELMDVDQVQERIEMTRTLQFVMLTAETAVGEFNSYICSLLGLTRVKPERNPLRPQAFVTALQKLFSQASVPVRIRVAWMNHMSVAFGEALRVSYENWAQKLRSSGVVPLTSIALGAREFGIGSVQRDTVKLKRSPTVLTLDRLRGLLAGELITATAAPVRSTIEQFSRDFDSSFMFGSGGREAAERSPDTDFANTVPAAYEALQEMQQVDHMVDRIERRAPAVAVVEETSPEFVRQQLLSRCRHSSQVLSLEVVSLMVENLVNDTRLLKPVRRVVEDLEPALLRLVLADARFFSDKQHPARVLLLEITQRGLAFGATDTPEFGAFLMSLHRFVSPLSTLRLDSAEPFDLALRSLQSLWKEGASQNTQTSQRGRAVEALLRAEERNLLAEKMVAAMEFIPELQRVPSSVAEFLCGPWAQVMAFAELDDTENSDDPGEYKELVNALLWSAQPDLTRGNIDKLTKLVPRLLSKLREGLSLIDYPSLKTSVFFDTLMKLHQQAFKPPIKVLESTQTSGLAASLLGNQDHWVVPVEAKASGFMDLSDDDAKSDAAQSHENQTTDLLAKMPSAGKVNGEVADMDSVALPNVGMWVELLFKGIWQRTQLTWISPQSTMYLFTSVHGQTQSMTRRSLDKMIATGILRVLSDHSMIDSALDSVVQKAMLNSLDIRLQ